MILRFNQRNNTIVRNQTKPVYDLSVLTFDERLELLNLMKKAKSTEDELSGVILRERKVEEITKVEEAVVIEETKNIDLIKVKKERVELLKGGLTLFQAKEKLKQALEEKAKEKFKQITIKTSNDTSQH
jgi:hypothetical protein